MVTVHTVHIQAEHCYLKTQCHISTDEHSGRSRIVMDRLFSPNSEPGRSRLIRELFEIFSFEGLRKTINSVTTRYPHIQSRKQRNQHGAHTDRPGPTLQRYG
ncbi:hypothetical protein DPMN_134105 [Dreissena polymorpha]|uniref:Uncharacterized protein n=1 Tax=Dreissena polymorpha TaxID=45954 RepID=A0A9D4FWM2_DREPO|nr:hypothetical protein DPMN_134105 [Dreissena polymorpha]